MAREKVDNKLNVVIGTKAQIVDDTTIPENSIIITTDEELTPSDIPNLDAGKITSGTFIDARIPTLAISKVTNLQSSLDNKVDKESGKGLSTNDFTNTLKTKLNGIASGAEVNVQSDWDATSGDAFIKNKPKTVVATPEMTEKVGLNATNELVVKPSSGAGGGIPEAPTDDKLYGRKNGSWSEVISGSGSGDVASVNDKTGVVVLNQDDIEDGTTYKRFSKTEKDKLDGIAVGAQVNTVTSVADKTGVVTLTKSDVGLENVDNTSDANKPVSTAQATAIAVKADKTYVDEQVSTKIDKADIIDDLTTDDDSKVLSAAQGKVLQDKYNDLADVAKSGNYDDLTNTPTIPPAYTLPIATSTVLGGVKPVAKTTAMTQSVGVDASGQLYTTPGSGGSGDVNSVNDKTGVVVLSQDDIGDGTTYKRFSQTEKTKLDDMPTPSTIVVDDDLAIVATSGSYNDLIDKPDLTKKLDKDFSALPNQASPLLNDVLVINRGAVAQKTTLGNLLAQVDAEIFVVVATLPATGVVNKIYLVPKTTPESQDSYDEYIWVNNAWELIGSVKLDLSNYYNKTEANGLLSAKVDKNNAITAGTKTKITYDAKGLVTAGSDLVESDIPPLAISKITGLQTALDDLDATIGNIDSILDSILGV